MGTFERESCNVCSKLIYLHDFIVICSLDGKISHSKCFGFSNDISIDILNNEDWICPSCNADIYPFFDSCYVPSITICCGSCSKFISSTRQCVKICDICSKRCHDFCMSGKYCHQCYVSIVSNTHYDSEFLNNYDHFNPYLHADEDNFFDEDIDDYCETMNIAKRTLSNCKYYEPETLPYSKFCGTSFYFNNIDGFQSNFSEFKNQCLNYESSYDFYCFNETNVSRCSS